MSGYTKNTIREACMKASSFLQSQGVEDGAASAEELLCHMMGWDRTALFLHWSDPFPRQKYAEWQADLQRRVAGEPVQYITGKQDFYGGEFYVNPSVLIPRPETELLVEAIIEESRKLWPSHISARPVADRPQPHTADRSEPHPAGPQATPPLDSRPAPEQVSDPSDSDPSELREAHETFHLNRYPMETSATLRSPPL